MSQATCLCAPSDARARPAARPSGRSAWGYVAWLAAAVDRLARLRRRRAAIQDLHRLGDRALRDIGIGRGEIDAIVDEMMEGRQPIKQRR